MDNSNLLSFPKNQPNEYHSYHLYIIRVNHRKRDLIRKFCLESNIPVSIHYQRLFIKTVSQITNKIT